MMFKISTLLSWISLAVIPVSLVITLLIARQSQKQFIRQWNSTGAVNAHVEEMFTGHNLVKAFNREKDVPRSFFVKLFAISSTICLIGELKKKVTVSPNSNLSARRFPRCSIFENVNNLKFFLLILKPLSCKLLLSESLRLL